MPRKIIFTESQIEELRNLVDQGTRQLDIAKHFSVTDDTIRRICRENEISVNMPHKCTCVICGELFYSNRKDSKTCRKEHHRNCAYCGKDFVVDRNNIRDTCSPKCYSLSKYGVEHPSASSEVKARRISSLQEKYGISNVSQLADHKEKSEATMLEKYGATSWAGSEIGKSTRRAIKDVLTRMSQWLEIVIANIPNALNYIMVCKQVDPVYEKYIVESKENKSHFGSNTEYVLVVNKRSEMLE